MLFCVLDMFSNSALSEALKLSRFSARVLWNLEQLVEQRFGTSQTCRPYNIVCCRKFLWLSNVNAEGWAFVFRVSFSFWLKFLSSDAKSNMIVQFILICFDNGKIFVVFSTLWTELREVQWKCNANVIFGFDNAVLFSSYFEMQFV